jgi:hypothetical protein
LGLQQHSKVSLVKTVLIVGGIAAAAGAVYWFVLRRPNLPPQGVLSVNPNKPTLCDTVVSTAGVTATKTGNPIATVSGIAAAATAPLLCKGATWALKEGVKGAKVVGKKSSQVAKVYAEGYAKLAITPAMLSYKVIAHPIDTAKLVGKDAKVAVGAGKDLAKFGFGAVKNPIGATKKVGGIAKTVAKSPIKSSKKVLSAGSKLLGGFHF